MELDNGIGQILSRLRSLGIENDTFVFFTSDNGAALISAPNEGTAGPTFIHLYFFVFDVLLQVFCGLCVIRRKQRAVSLWEADHLRRGHEGARHRLVARTRPRRRSKQTSAL